MLPPVDTTILSSNPKFSALYHDLCTNRSNPDGTSKIYDAKALKEGEAFAEDLRKARVQVARRDLVVSGLRELSYESDALPDDLQELVAVIAAVLKGQVAEEDRDLLQDDVAKFKTNVTDIARALSLCFKRDLATLSTLVDPDDPPSTQELVPIILKLQTSLMGSEAHLNTSRLRLATEAAKAHDLDRVATKQSIVVLEKTIHGSVARGSKAKAEYLATVAEGMSKKLSLQECQLQSQLYSPEVQDALRTKAQEIEENSRVRKRKVRGAEERLEGYRGIRGMQGVAREYAEVLAEAKRIRGEVERLEGGS